MRTWDDVDRALRQVGELDEQIAVREAALTEAVNAERLKADKRIRPLAEQRAALLDQVEAFAISNREDLGDAKSWKGNFGKVGWRSSTQLVVEVPESQALSRLRALGMLGCVRTKTTVALDKTALKAFGDEVLAKVGVRRQVDESFFAEPAREQVRAAS